MSKIKMCAMQEYRTKLGKYGKIVIPANCRGILHFQRSEELIIHIDDELPLCSLRQSIKKVQEVVRKYSKSKSLVDKLKEMRKSY